MHEFTSEFPYLNQLLGAYFNQDWRLDHDTVEEVIADFVEVSHAVNVWATIADIRRFLLYNADAEAAYDRLFPWEIRSPDPSEDVAQWLRRLERLIVEGAPRLPE